MAPQRRNYKTKRYTRDIDQVQRDLHEPKQLDQLLSVVPSDERPGLGAYYCTPCAKFFETEHAQMTHERMKPHKKRLRALRDEPYTQEEANAAAGVGVDHGKSRVGVKANEVLAKVSRNRIVLSETETTSAPMDIDSGTGDVVEDDEL